VPFVDVPVGLSECLQRTNDLDRFGPYLLAELLAFVDFRPILLVFHGGARFRGLCQTAPRFPRVRHLLSQEIFGNPGSRTTQG
jgi:hypothetical protein